MAFDKLSASYAQLRPDTPATARDAVEELIRTIHEEHIFPFHQAGHPQATDMDLSLIVGIRCGNGEVALIKTSNTGALLCDRAEAVGVGASIFTYWASYFLSPKTNMELVGYLCMFILREVKHVGYACGGDTEIYKLPSDQEKFRKRLTFWDENELLAGFPQTTIQMLLACADLRVEDIPFPNCPANT